MTVGPSTSPDLAPFVDLTLLDLDPGDLVDAAVAAVATVLPGLTLREGFLESAFLEAQAAMDAMVAYRVNRLPPAIMEGVMNLFGLVRDPGAPPVADALLTAADTIGHTILAGTTLSLDLGNGDTELFTTDVTVQILAGQSTTTAAITGTTIGAAANGFPAGTPLQIIDNVSFLNTAALDAVVSSGRPVQSDSDFYTRGAQTLAGLSSAILTPAQFTAKALAQPYVYRCLALDNTAPPASFGPGLNPGNITLALLGPAGLQLSSADQTSLLALLGAQAASFLQIWIVTPNIANVDVTASLKMLPGYTATQVQVAATTALQAYLNPLSWPWAAVVRRNELIALLSDVPGVDYVVSISAPAADINLTGIAPLAKAHTLSITVT